MTEPTEKATARMKKDAADKKQREDDIAAATRVGDDMPPIAPVTSFDEEESKPHVQKKFYPLPRKSEEKEITDEKVIIVSICRVGGGCIPTKMDSATAQKWCDAANKLYKSEVPTDWDKAEKAWSLLAQGKEAAGIQMLGIGPDARSTAKMKPAMMAPPPTASLKLHAEMPQSPPLSVKPEPEAPKTPENENNAPSPFNRKMKPW